LPEWTRVREQGVNSFPASETQRTPGFSVCLPSAWPKFFGVSAFRGTRGDAEGALPPRILREILIETPARTPLSRLPMGKKAVALVLLKFFHS
jgi:hypothetical protein